MKCTGDEWDHCRVEKMGCYGCYYNDIDIEKAKEKLKLLSIGDFVTWFTSDGIVEMEVAAKTLLQYVEQLEKENKLLYLKGLHNGKEQATADLTITKQKIAEDTLRENVRLKKELDNKNKEAEQLKKENTENDELKKILESKNKIKVLNFKGENRL